MTEHSFLSGVCPRCGNTIQVPGELDSFSCVYCGQRLTPDNLIPQESVNDSLTPDERKSLTEKLAKALPGAVTNHLNIFKHFTKKAYPKYFENYLDQYQVTFEGLIPLCRGFQGQTSAKELAERVIAALDKWAEENRSKLSSKDRVLDEIKYTLCLLTIPGIMSLEHKACSTFCHALHDAWLTAYPGNDFQVVTYEKITEGFQPRKLCYITTATCRQAGKPDDCPELTAFRSFRDGYLSAQPHGESLIGQYYELAPGICMAIDLCCDPDATYPLLWQRHLAPCYEALNRGDNAACEKLYTKMVEQLSTPGYLSSMNKQ